MGVKRGLVVLVVGMIALGQTVLQRQAVALELESPQLEKGDFVDCLIQANLEILEQVSNPRSSSTKPLEKPENTIFFARDQLRENNKRNKKYFNIHVFDSNKSQKIAIELVSDYPLDIAVISEDGSWSSSSTMFSFDSNPTRIFGTSILPSAGKYLIVLSTENLVESIPYELAIGDVSIKKFEPSKSIFIKKADLILNEASRSRESRDYQKALLLYNQALSLYETVEDSIGSAVVSVGISSIYELIGKNEVALEWAKRSFCINQELDTRKEFPLATRLGTWESLSRVSSLYQDLGHYNKSLKLDKILLEILDDHKNPADLLKENRAKYAATINSIGVTYFSLGNFEKAIGFFENAVNLARQNQDSKAQESYLNNLGNVYMGLGRYRQALNVLKLSLEMSQESEDYLLEAQILINIGTVYSQIGQYLEARSAYEYAILLGRKTNVRENFPVDSKEVNGIALHGMSSAYYGLGKYEKSIEYSQKSILIAQEIGNKQLEGAALNNVALSYILLAEYKKGLEIYKTALSLRSQAGDSQGKMQTMRNMFSAYWAIGDVKNALNYLSEVLSLEEKNLFLTLSIGSEKNKKEFIETFSSRTQSTVSFDLQTNSGNSELSTILAVNTILQRKGRILDLVSSSALIDYSQLSPSAQKNIKQLELVRTKISNIFFEKSIYQSSSEFQEQLLALRSREEQIEQLLSLKMRKVNSTQQVNTGAVQALLPENTTLLEFSLYSHFYPKETTRENLLSQPRYAAYLLSPTGNPIGVDLGPAAPIDQLAANFRRALATKDPNIKTIARQLDAQLMQPIREKLGDLPAGKDRQQLLISPDSQLNLIPFAALVDENDEYLVENYDISYLTSGRDILRLNNPELQYQPKQGPLLVANPDYANPGNPTLAQTQTKESRKDSDSPLPSLGEGPGERASLAQASISDPGQPNRRSTDLNRAFNNFGPLPGTAEEAQLIGQRLPNATVLTGTHATENAIKAVDAPSILHIATHGFFLNDLPKPDPNNSRGFGGFGDFRAGIRPVQGNGNAPLAPSFSAQTENPLLRSGLALAGFNQRSSGKEDGVLTALEAANLNLRGTQLVVLSACETGLGDIANGEGVYGLRRAFVMAGAETQLISLWKVDDFGTKDLMVSYYDKLIAGEGRADALHQTQRELLKTDQYNHPYYWASFISSGDWRPLDVEN